MHENGMKIVKAEEIGADILPEQMIDVRAATEFREVHIPGSRLVPLQEWTREKIAPLMGENCVLVCQSGKRSRMAAEKLTEWGCPDPVVLDGGINEWVGCGKAVEKGKKTISLERQTRIVMGALIFIGTVLGAFVSPYFLILSGFLSAGLIFSGITDWCGIAMVIAKMPWNQSR